MLFVEVSPSSVRCFIGIRPTAATVAALKDVCVDLQRPYLHDADEEFTPHLTLGYVRRGGSLDSSVRQRLRELGTRRFPGWKVDTVELMQGGGVYRTLSSFVVGGLGG